MSESANHIEPRFLAGAQSDLKLSWRSIACIVIYGATMLSIHLGGARALTYHEVLFAQPAREMLETGNWLMPTIAGIPSTHKPPGTHWSIAAAMALFSSNSEWVVRLPSVLAALVLALLVATIAARWFGERVGLVSGLIQLTTLYTLQWSRLAECDIFLWVAITAAMGIFAIGNVEGPRPRRVERWVVWLFYAATGASFMVKGMVGPAFVLSSCVLFFLVNQDLRGLKFFWSPVGLTLFGVFALAWPVTAFVAYPTILDDQIMHHFDRFRGDMGGQKTPFFYFYNLPLLLLPWTPFVVLAIVRGIRQGQYAVGFWRFAICWFVPGVMILALSQFKSKHYAAPLLPPFSIMAALGLLEFLRRGYGPQTQRRVWLTTGWLAGCAGGAIAIYLIWPKGATGVLCLLAILAAAGLVLAYLEARRLKTAHLAAIFATVWLIAVGVQVLVMPYHDGYRGQTEMAARLNRDLPEGHPLYLVELPENQIFYYLNRPVVRLDERAEFFERYSGLDAQELYLLVPEHLIESLSVTGQIEVLDRCSEMPKAFGPHERLTYLRLSRSLAAKPPDARDSRRR